MMLRHRRRRLGRSRLRHRRRHAALVPVVLLAAIGVVGLGTGAVLPADGRLALAAVAHGPVVRPITVPGSAGEGGYGSPVPGAVVRATFDAPPTPWSRGHRGVDLEAAAGAPVRAPAEGVVRFVGTVVDRGVVTIEHPDGLRSSMEPVQGEVEVGMRVPAGGVLGSVQDQASHCSDGPCVHWGVRRGTTYLDPLDLLPDGGPVVLLPVPAD